MSSIRRDPNVGLSINTLLIISFTVAAVVPVGLLGIKVYNAAWDNAWREVREKHQLLAENLAAPLTIYVSKHQSALAMAAELIADLEQRKRTSAQSATVILKTVLKQSQGLNAIYYFTSEKSL
ncbi:MAG: hypothetical protein ACC707_07910, partial [Thiohalomonadales bacterium]